jgi:hypothetical protein
VKVQEIQGQLTIGNDTWGLSAMLLTLKIVSVLLVAISMSLALAHALEFPGKLRLNRTPIWQYRRSTIRVSPLEESQSRWRQLRY